VGGALRRAGAVLALSLVLGACALNGLSLVVDDRVDVIAPGDRAEVTLPVTLRWTADTDELPTGASFAVFVDRAPQPPDRAPAWLFRNSTDCSGAECASEEYLERRDVYLVSDTELTISHVPPKNDEGRGRFHEATVVLLDDDGARIGEGAWSVRFEVEDS
jgi:hypothetical protein